MDLIRSSEITPEGVFLSRRQFMAGAAAVAASALASACNLGASAPTASPASQGASPSPTQSDGNLTPYDTITHYNNFFEFSTGKVEVASLAQGLVTDPWSVQVGGLVSKPRTFAIEDLRKFDQEERIYRLRCVETWSMVIPWLGFPLARLLNEVGPTSAAKFVRFETLLDPQQMPGQRRGPYTWPYAEGLRLDEAMHPLAILATGLYGQPLPPQSGAPIRLVVPWKYGFKSIKSIVRIDLVETPPVSFWASEQPGEYGFYANVNPEVPHPRWSQATESRIGETGRRPTLPFNGYAEEVASLYAGMDLKTNY